jgi:hypothetical protein
LLQGGIVLVIGGIISNGQTNLSEIYDPETATWSSRVPINVALLAHTSTLLINGKVLVTGGSTVSGDSNASELFDSGLGYSNSWQAQTIVANGPLPLAGSLQLTGSGFRGISEASGGNGAQDSSTDYPLVQLRRLDNDQTTFLTPTNFSATSFASSSITNFPKGYALATPFVNGIPGVAAIVFIAATPGATPILLTNPGKNPDGSFHFSFTNGHNATFTALAATNVAQPLSTWSSIGSVTEVSSGQFQFTDTQATNNSRRFYRVSWP